MFLCNFKTKLLFMNNYSERSIGSACHPEKWTVGAGISIPSFYPSRI